MRVVTFRVQEREVSWSLKGGVSRVPWDNWLRVAERELKGFRSSHCHDLLLVSTTLRKQVSCIA